MKNLLIANAKRVFLSEWYILSVIGTIVISYLGSKDYLNDTSGLAYIIELMINLGMYKKVIVFFSSMSCVTVFCQDYKSRYINSILSRTKENNYIVSNILVSVVSGFSSVFIGIMIFVLIASYKYPVQSFETNGIYSDLTSTNPFLYIIVIVSTFSLYSAMWTTCGLTLSSIMPDKYIALGSPLILGYLLEEITYRFPTLFNLYRLSHPGIKVFGNTVASNYLYTIMFFIIGIFISGCIFSYFVKRRIRNEMF